MTRHDTRVYTLALKSGPSQCFNMVELLRADKFFVDRRMSWDSDMMVRYIKFRKFVGAKDPIYMDEFWITSTPALRKYLKELYSSYYSDSRHYCNLI